MKLRGCIAIALLAWATGSVAHAGEPPSPKWTRVGAETVPDHLVHYATLPPDRARELLQRADVSLLYDRTDGLDLVPMRELSFRSVDGLTRQERFRIGRADEGGYGLWDAWERVQGQPVRIDGPDRPILRILGLPTAGPGPQPRRAPTPLAAFDPVILEMPGELFAIRMVTLRVRDPLDPSRETATARLVTGTPISLDALLPEPRSTYRMVLTFQSARNATEPRVLFLPIDGDGELDETREGVLIRLAVTGTRVDPWTRQLDDAMQAVAVRIHLGDRDSLDSWLDAQPPPDRGLYAQPGSPADPLLMGPRGHRSPIGAGVQVRTGGEGRITVIEPFDPNPSPAAVQPAFSGVDLDAWVGRAAMGVSVSPDLIGVQLGIRAGSMRDTDSTLASVEVALPAGSYSLREAGISGVIRARRRTSTTLVRRTVEVGSDLRIGTLGFDYRALAGVRVYGGRGWVVTPTAFAGFRYGLPSQRGQIVLGLALDSAKNLNVFRRRSSAAQEAAEVEL